MVHMQNLKKGLKAAFSPPCESEESQSMDDKTRPLERTGQDDLAYGQLSGARADGTNRKPMSEQQLPQASADYNVTERTPHGVAVAANKQAERTGYFSASQQKQQRASYHQQSSTQMPVNPQHRKAQKSNMITKGSPHSTRPSGPLQGNDYNKYPRGHKNSLNGPNRVWPDETNKDVDLQQQVLDLRNERSEYQQMIQKLENELRALKQQNGALSEEICCLQASSFTSMEDARWMPMDSGKIAGKLEEIRADIWDLAKKYTVESMADPDREGDTLKHKRDLLSSLQQVVRFKSVEVEVEALDELMGINRASRLCTAALISSWIHREILGDPFFFMSDNTDTTLEPLSTKCKVPQLSLDPPRSFSDVWLSGCEYDSRKANIWRSDTLRLLSSTQLDDHVVNPRVASVMSSINTCCANYAEHYASRIPKPFLRRMESSTYAEFVEKLATICQRAGQLSRQLWLQRPSVHCKCLADLSDVRFNIKGEILKAHTLHQIDDPEDHSLDGKSIKILVHPAVLTAGSHEAERYDEYSVLAPAVVWLDVD